MNHIGVFKTALIFLSCVALSDPAVAGLIDFTSSEWKNEYENAISHNAGVDEISQLTVGDVTITSSSGFLSFNGAAPELPGCQNGKVANTHDLECLGDGVGVHQSGSTRFQGEYDEISASLGQYLTIEFSKNVNILEISFLDLFTNTKLNGVQIDVIESVDVTYFTGSSQFSESYSSSDGIGGYAESSNTSAIQNVYKLEVRAGDDFLLNSAGEKVLFNDVALASITAVEVPEPSTYILMLMAGIFFLYRKTH